VEVSRLDPAQAAALEDARSSVAEHDRTPDPGAAVRSRCVDVIHEIDELGFAGNVRVERRDANDQRGGVLIEGGQPLGVGELDRHCER
jgi:hypothetical protein